MKATYLMQEIVISHREFFRWFIGTVKMIAEGDDMEAITNLVRNIAGLEIKKGGKA